MRALSRIPGVCRTSQNRIFAGQAEALGAVKRFPALSPPSWREPPRKRVAPTGSRYCGGQLSCGPPWGGGSRYIKELGLRTRPGWHSTPPVLRNCMS